jgi:hypothetical protein
MRSLVLVGLFVGLGFIMAVGFISVVRDLLLRIAVPPLLNPEDNDETDETASVSRTLVNSVKSAPSRAFHPLSNGELRESNR